MRSYTLSNTRPIVIAIYGGFNLSEKAKTTIAHIRNLPPTEQSLLAAEQHARENRDSDSLILAIKLLGAKEASAENCMLKVVDIPSDVEWEISECYGVEWVSEKHRTWK
jgi:hypothetical protein